MKISITSAIGHGNTELSAFDSALLGAGVANTNLLVLSSVIPPNPEIAIEKPKIPESDFGKRLYVVMAENRASSKGVKIAAGVGWVIEKNGKFGLFVEHVGETATEIKELINQSLHDMIASRNEYSFSTIEMKVEEAVCEEKSLCVLCCAVYKLENW